MEFRHGMGAPAPRRPPQGEDGVYAGQVLSDRQPGDGAADDQALDLAGAFEDGEDLRGRTRDQRFPRSSLQTPRVQHAQTRAENAQTRKIISRSSPTPAQPLTGFLRGSPGLQAGEESE